MASASTLSIKELRAALSSRHIDYTTCIEKHELIRLLETAEAAHDAPPIIAEVADDAPSSAKRRRGSDSPPSGNQRRGSDSPPSGNRWRGSNSVPSGNRWRGSDSLPSGNRRRGSDSLPSGNTALCSDGREEELRSRLIRVLPPPERRFKEPDDALLFAPHHIPKLAADQLRICTFNVLDDARVSKGQGGVHAVFDVRRINLLRSMIAIDADAILCQELSEKSISFLLATLGHEFALEAYDGQLGGVGILYRRTPRPGRAVHFVPAGRPSKRPIPAPPPSKALMGIVLHVPLECRGLAGSAPFPLVLSTTHLTCVERGQLQSSNKHAATYAAHLGRDLIRMPARHGWCPMLLGGDFNTVRGLGHTRGGPTRRGTIAPLHRMASPPQASSTGSPPALRVSQGPHGKSATCGGRESLYSELTRPLRRTADSEDEWDEDDGQPDAALRWPPSDTRPLAVDLWRTRSVRQREYGGLQRGSTCSSWVVQHGIDGHQGVRARAARDGWAEGGDCTDAGHIDWLLASCIHGERVQTRLRPVRALIGTERLIPPLPPQQPSLIGAAVLPPGGCIFGSDHYPVVVDLEVQRGATTE